MADFLKVRRLNIISLAGCGSLSETSELLCKPEAARFKQAGGVAAAS
jgi:hypothetical protein